MPPGPPPTTATYDALLDAARPANVQDEVTHDGDDNGDEVTHKRPRGRPPAGKVWNAATGEWEDAGGAQVDAAHAEGLQPGLQPGTKRDQENINIS